MGCGNVGCSCPYDHLRLKAIHLDAVNAFLRRGPDGRIRRIDLDFGLGILGDAEVREPLPDLDLDLCPLHGCDFCLRIITETKDVCMVELELGLGTVSCGDPVATGHGLIQRRPRPVTRIAALHRNVALDQADARHSGRNVHLCAGK